MFTGLTALLDKIAFWFIFTCVCCLIYSVLAAFLYGSIPSNILLAFADLIALLWCYFAGTLTVLCMGIKKVLGIFDTHE